MREIVIRVGFIEWTANGKLRHPRLLSVVMIITHPEKIMFPADGITKGELASYYEAIAPVMLPHLIRRPITMERFHRGIEAPGFFQKDVSKGFRNGLNGLKCRSMAARSIIRS